jgi:hypothetical protein
MSSISSQKYPVHQKILYSQQYYFFKKISSKLAEGGTVDFREIYDYLIKSIDNDNLLARGIIVDLSPFHFVGYDYQKHLNALQDVISKYKNCVLIDLRITTQDLIRRRAGLWTDPVTNITYPGQQVYYSKQRRQTGWTGDEEDEELIKEIQLTEPVFRAKAPEKKTEEDEFDGNENLKEKVLPPAAQSKTYLPNRKCYPILSELILDRLELVN